MSGQSAATMDAKRAALLDALAHGLPRRAAAAHAGVGTGTLYRWLDDDEGFREACETAEARFIHENVTAIADIAAKSRSWRARAWLLERVRPDLFGLRTELDLGLAER